jgi:hypothetical protein
VLTGCLKTSIGPSAKADIRLRLEAQNKVRPNPTGFQLRASSFQPIACEHLQKPHNAGSRPAARFFNTLQVGLNRESERIPRRLRRGKRANHKRTAFFTVEDSLQLAAGIFNRAESCL